MVLDVRVTGKNSKMCRFQGGLTQDSWNLEPTNQMGIVVGRIFWFGQTQYARQKAGLSPSILSNQIKSSNGLLGLDAGISGGNVRI